MTASMLFQGLTDQTLAHDQRWQFAQAAKYLERIDVTCRVIEMKYTILQSIGGQMETALRNIQWMAVLRSCCSIEAYRRHHLGEMDPMRVASFLILERNFPAKRAVCPGRGPRSDRPRSATETGTVAIDPAERILGRLNAQLEYAEPSEILTAGIPAYVQKIQTAGRRGGTGGAETVFLVLMGSGVFPSGRNFDLGLARENP